MGGGGSGGERFSRDDRRPRDRDERDAPREKTHRNFERFSGENKDGEESDPKPRNGLSRGKSEPWFKANEGNSDVLPVPRERFDRIKSWREREKDNSGDALEERGGGRYERRWDRERNDRVERDPEWMDEPAEEKAGGHTEEDFKKFMEAMKASRGGGPPAEEKPAPVEAVESAIQAEKPVVQSAPALEPGPDKFFAAFSMPSAGIEGVPTPGDAKDPATARPKAPTGKASRFTSFFNASQEERGRQTEPPTPAVAPPPAAAPPLQQQPPLNTNGFGIGSSADNADRAGFQALLLKLQRQKPQGTSAPPESQALFPEPPPPQPAPPVQEMVQKRAMASPEAFQQYMPERREDPRARPAQHSVQEILAPRPMQPPSQPPSARPEQQLLQDLVGQRQHQPSQGPARPDQSASRNNNNTEFLIQLMQRMPEGQRTEQRLAQMNQAQRQNQMPPPMPQPMMDREHPDMFVRERGPAQRPMRSQLPPGYMDEPPFHHLEPDSRPPPQQPTQILQRPGPPPGLDQMGPGPGPNWMPGVGQGPPPRQHMIPPPGLPGGPNRNMPMPGMFPPGFVPGGFGPPDSMVGPPPQQNIQPPPGFFPRHPPPPGFIPPPGMGGFQGPPGPDGHGYGGIPFETRGMPPPGAGAQFRR
jgi:hypothetical protein